MNTAQLAKGLLAGQLRAAIEDISLLRQARQALEQPTALVTNPANLEWQDLTKEEQEYCSPLLLLANEEESGRIKQLLNTDLHSIVYHDLQAKLNILKRVLISYSYVVMLIQEDY